jgi:carboxypeptidase family protein
VLKRRTSFCGTLTVSLLIGFSPSLWSQVVVNGTITDESKQPIESARVTLEAQTPGAILATNSNKNGEFNFNLSSAGRYLVSISGSGFYEINRSPVDLIVGANIVTIDLIARDRTNFSIEVSPEKNLVVEQVALSQTLKEDEIMSIPATRWNFFENMVAVMPGALRDQSGKLHFYGSPSDQINWLLDGFNVADPSSGELETSLSVEAVQSFDLYSGRYSVEFGRGSGGTMIINSKMGNNTFERHLTNFLPGFDYVNGLRLVSFRPKFSLSGPIKKDKVWFFNGLDFNYRENIFSELPKGQDRTLTWTLSNLFRVQANLAPGNVLTGGFLYNYLNSPKIGLSALDPVETTLDLRSRRYFVDVKDQIFLPSKSIVEFGYAAYRAVNREVPLGHALYQITPFGHGGNFFRDTRRLGDRDQWIANWFLPPFDGWGNHQFKMGLDFTYSRYYQDIRRTGFEYFRVDKTLANRVLFGGNGEFSDSNLESGAYFQDRWAVRPWLLAEAGVRWDRDRFLGDSVVTPRFSFALKPPGLKNTKFSAGFGLIPATTNLRLFTRDQDQYSIATHFGPDGTTVIGGPSLTLLTLDRRQIRIPKTKNFSVGAEQALPRNFYFRANYLRKRGHSGYTFAALDETSLVPESPPPGGYPIGRLYQLQNSRLEEYDSLDVSLENQFRKKYNWFLSYARSRAFSNAAFDVSIDEPIIFTDLAGRLPWDSPNRLLSWGFFPITKNNTVVYFLEWRDGFRFTAHDDEGRQVGKANDWEFPRYFTFNLHLERKASWLGNSWAIRLGFDNITNHGNYSLANSNIDSPDFLHYYGNQPRKLVLRIRWLGKSPG